MTPDLMKAGTLAKIEHERRVALLGSSGGGGGRETS